MTTTSSLKAEDPAKIRLGVLVAIVSAAIFGLWPAAVRGAYETGANVAFILPLTTWVRALAMAAFCLTTQRRLFATKEGTRQSMVGGAFQAVCMLGIYAALTFLPGPLAIIILFSHTLMLLFYMAWRREIRLDRATVFMTALALAGLTLVVDLWHPQPVSNFLGIGLAAVAALATVGRLYAYGRQTKDRHPIIVGAENFLVAAVFVLPVMAWQAPHAPVVLAGWLYALLGCASLTVGTFGFFHGIALMGAFRWSLFGKIEPVFTALFSTLLLHETLKLSQYAGIALVVGSLAAYQLVDQRNRTRSAKNSGARD